MTMFYNKASQMDPHVSRLVVPVTVSDHIGSEKSGIGALISKLLRHLFFILTG